MGLVFEAFSLLTMQVGGSRRLEGVSEKDTTAQPFSQKRHQVCLAFYRNQYKAFLFFPSVPALFACPGLHKALQLLYTSASLSTERFL